MSGRRKAPLAPSSLTSLVDVLFILVFAALVQRASAAKEATAEDGDAAEVTVTGAAVGAKGPGGQGAAVAAQREALRQAAISTLAAELEERPAIIARVARSGVLTKLEAPGLGGAEGGDGGLTVELPLIEPVSDPDVAVGYVGDRDPAKRICAVIAARLGAAGGGASAGSTPTLERSLVVIAVDAPVSELMVALVGGLRRDVAHCLSAHRTAAVLLDAAAVARLSTSTRTSGEAGSPDSTTGAPSASPSAAAPQTTIPSTPTDGEAP